MMNDFGSALLRLNCTRPVLVITEAEQLLFLCDYLLHVVVLGWGKGGLLHCMNMSMFLGSSIAQE